MNRYIAFSVSILLGLLISVYYGWSARSVSVSDANPTLLRLDFRHDYVLMVAEAFEADPDVEQAISRLGFLGVAGQPYNPLDLVSDTLLFGTENGYLVTDLELLQSLEQALLSYDPRFGPTPTP
ncbi:MAG: hypothetical protein WD751_01490 [Anaerolineales bacterium]